MNNDIKKLIDTSLEDYEGIQIDVEVGLGEDIYDTIKEDILYALKKEPKGSFFVKDFNDKSYMVNIIDKDTNKISISYKIDIVKEDSVIAENIDHIDFKKHRKNKYEKQVYINRKINLYVNSIGITNAQIAHAKDVEVEKYIKLRDFLKDNRNSFSKKSLYIKDLDGNIIRLRHKNLFSKYKDEISDFEKVTYFERLEDGMLQISYNLDEDIFEYAENEFTLTERKNARNFAKDIYYKKGLYTDKQLIKLLKDQDVYIKVEEVLKANNKMVWSKVLVSNMDGKTLKNEYVNYYKTKKERVKNIQLKYLSKRDKKRKLRREGKKINNLLRKEIQEGI